MMTSPNVLQCLLLSFITWAGAREYCQWEQLVAECARGEVVLIQHAEYGIMRNSPCVKRDYGFVGCSLDVRHLADTVCSGRQRCTLHVPNRAFDEAMVSSSCPEDLKSHLRANYTCLKVQMPPGNCAGSQRVLVTSSDEGYLASTVTYSTNCGFASTPWVLQAQPGQKYIISLTDFAAAPLHQNLLPSNGGEAAASGRGGLSLDHCRVVYAVIKEPQSALHQLSMTVCSLPGAKDEVVYTSQGHEVEVRIRGSSLSISNDEGEGSAFLLHYTVTGCAEAAAAKPVGGWCRMREEVGQQEMEAGCDDVQEDVLWRLHCQGTTWTGSMGNCTTTPGSGAQLQSDVNLAFYHIPSIITVLCLAVPVSLIVLAIGMLLVYRYQMKKKALRKPLPNYGYSAKQLATLRGLSLPPPGGPGGYYDSVPPLYGGTLPPAFPHHVPVTRQHSYACPEDDLDSHYAYIDDVQREIAASRTMPRLSSSSNSHQPYSSGYSSSAGVYGRHSFSRADMLRRDSARRLIRPVPTVGLPQNGHNDTRGNESDYPESLPSSPVAVATTNSPRRKSGPQRHYQDGAGMAPDYFVLDPSMHRVLANENHRNRETVN